MQYLSSLFSDLCIEYWLSFRSGPRRLAKGVLPRARTSRAGRPAQRSVDDRPSLGHSRLQYRDRRSSARVYRSTFLVLMRVTHGPCVHLFSGESSLASHLPGLDYSSGGSTRQVVKSHACSSLCVPSVTVSNMPILGSRSTCNLRKTWSPTGENLCDYYSKKGSGTVVTVVNGSNVAMRCWEGLASQKWECVEKDGWLGFVSIPHGAYLGHDAVESVI